MVKQQKTRVFFTDTLTHTRARARSLLLKNSSSRRKVTHAELNLMLNLNTLMKRCHFSQLIKIIILFCKQLQQLNCSCSLQRMQPT